MRKRIIIIASLIMAAALCVVAYIIFQQNTADNPSAVSSSNVSPSPSEEKEAIKIAFFISDPDSVFEQAQFNEAKRHAKEKYGAEVLAFDGSQDKEYSSKSFDQIKTQGIKMISLAMKEPEDLKEEVLQLIEEGIFVNSYFIPFADTGIPAISSEESDSSYKMGAQMAQKWKEANPDKPLVMVQLGYPQNKAYNTGRTQPFVEGVLSIDAAATDLGCMDISKGSDAARLIILDICEKHPEVNLIYIEDSKITNSVMDALYQAGRGEFSEGKPKTEIICLAECNKNVIEKIYDPNSSIKSAMGLSPVEIARARIDNLFDIAGEKVKQVEQQSRKINSSVFDISYWTVKREEAEEWYRLNFGE